MPSLSSLLFIIVLISTRIQNSLAQQTRSLSSSLLSSPLATYFPTPFCINLSCTNEYVPSPYYFIAFATCNCSAPLTVNLLLPVTPFLNFTDTNAEELRVELGIALNLFPAQVWVQSANLTSANETLVAIQLFPLDLQPWSLASLALVVAPLELNTTILGPHFGPSTFVSVQGVSFPSTPPVFATLSPVPLPASPGPPPSSSLSSPPSKSSDLPLWTTGYIILGCLVVIALVLLVIWRGLAGRAVDVYWYRNAPPSAETENQLARVAGGLSRQQSKFGQKVQEYFLREYSLEDLSEATNGFDDDMILGTGGYGTVYRGKSPDGVEWAVKRAKKKDNTNVEDFQNEVDVISKMSHRNLVRLLGYCEEKNEQILVYEFVPNGNLRQHLRHNIAGQALSASPGHQVLGTLNFQQRLEVAIGAAEGLRYLHSFAKPPIIHRDVKSENILLDADYQAKVADFGVFKHIKVVDPGMVPADATGTTMNTKVVGTPGYLDPEYYQTYKVTAKSDVYSFGVVLLELITGQPSIMKDPNSGTDAMMTLARWAIPKIASGKVDVIVDAALGEDYPRQALQMLASIASMCVRRQGRERPEMAEVATRLNEIKYFLKPSTAQDLEEAGMDAHEALMASGYHMGGSSVSQTYNISSQKDTAPVSTLFVDR
eukprot:TRINITY_DN2261_c0_g4_i1.p1 TRINITY_DN2261_c0_g4~~TRINITY_DN2261_c0_g4_i1.p1  ORF type:complete len:656 (+),score=128.53 TRINITY_DN2261_c0_g4_i1:422-2389(+)